MENGLDGKLVTAFKVLDYTLCDAEGAPVRKALRDKGIGQDVYSLLELGMKQPSFSVISKYTDPERKEEFVSTIEETLRGLVANGFDRKALMAVIWGVLPLDEGFVSIDGEPITDLSAPYLRRSMAYLPSSVRWADEERNAVPFVEQRKQLLQEIVKRQPRLLLVDGVTEEELPICRQLAEQGTAVVVFW